MMSNSHIWQSERLEFKSNLSAGSENKEIYVNNFNDQEEQDYSRCSPISQKYNPRLAVFIDT